MGLSQPNRGPAPWPEVHHSCRTGTFVRLCKTWLISHRMDQAQYGPFSNSSHLQCTSSWVPGGAILHLVSLEFVCFLGYINLLLLFKVSKMNINNFDLIKVSKMIIKIFDLFKVSKMTLVKSNHLKSKVFLKVTS